MSSNVRIPGGRQSIAALAMLALLSCCATASRGPAATLATAGISSTNALSREYRTTASRLREVGTMTAFTRTFKSCNIDPTDCDPQIQADSLQAKRERLAHAVELRGRAVEALGKAYAALKTEADYDARGDLVSATDSAISSVNSFATAISAPGLGAGAPGADLITQPLRGIVGLGAGLIADRAQAKRLRNGSIKIREATERLRDALKVEAWVYHSLSEYLVERRMNAKLALLKAGLASNQSVVTPMIDSLELKPADGMEATIRKSVPAQAAVLAMVEAGTRNEIAATQAKYGSAVKALDELIKAHGEFEKKQPLSLADLERFLSELNVAAGPLKQGE